MGISWFCAPTPQPNASPRNRVAGVQWECACKRNGITTDPPRRRTLDESWKRLGKVIRQLWVRFPSGAFMTRHTISDIFNPAVLEAVMEDIIGRNNGQMFATLLADPIRIELFFRFAGEEVKQILPSITLMEIARLCRSGHEGHWIDVSALIYPEMEELAAKVREKWQLADEPVLTGERRFD